ncbi:MAG: hypothetical protein AAGF96_06060 [Bacteroidota bacterium]
MAKDFTFPFLYKEWLVSTQGMDADVRGWYINLLAHQADKGALPNDIESLAELAGVKFSKYVRFKECFNHTLAAKFPVNEDGNRANEIMKGIKDERDNYKANQRRRGIVGAFIKIQRKTHNLKKSQWDSISKELMNVDFTKSKNEIDIALSIRFKHTLQAFIDSEDDNESNSKDNDDEDHTELWPTFDDFWDLYDKKIGKKEKIKSKFDRLPHKTKEAIMAFIPDYKRSQPDKQYRKNPETFLNNESWNDELIQINGNRSTNNARTDAELKSTSSDVVDQLLR